MLRLCDRRGCYTVKCVLSNLDLYSFDFAYCVPMAGLVSPKPVSYLHGNGQFANYTRAFANFSSDTPPIPSAPSVQQHTGQGFANPVGVNVAMHEDGKIHALVIQLMDPTTREAALLELSKKREQHDDLALILWHSFGKRIYRLPADLLDTDLIPYFIYLFRYHARSSSGDRFCLSSSFSSKPYGSCFQSGLQCAGVVAMRRLTFRNTSALSQWYVH